ncbi:MAG: NAD(P)H-quinone oxidoreductase subunit F [Desertifilum sp.]|nr:NAD(P)H-quinone oxidoreductase subunit F [Desertifilum sp.]
MAQLLLGSVWLVPCYALIGGLLAAFWSPAISRKTGPRPSGYLNALMTFVAFIHSSFALSAIWQQPAQHLSFTWLEAAGLNLTLNLEVSATSVGAMVLVTGINLLSQIYAIGYMEMDWGWARFYSLLGLFEAGMCGLALCDSLFFSYVILEILTLGTYLLVGLWFSQPLVVTGARDAFLTKRVGDLVLLMAVVALYPLAGTWNFSELAQWAQTVQLDPKVATLLGLALIAGPMGKCAQFPLHLWLDEAMEGPVPSTILRNSVVVTTGAWVLVKLEPVLALSPWVLKTTVFIGAVTAVGASLIAIAQIDIKRILSYSVSAYMGLVFIAVGTQQPHTALMLVLGFALAMALLVMVTGGIIWNNITQDVTQYGGLGSRRPISAIAFIVGSWGLIGLPPLGEFWGLSQLLEHLWQTQPVLAGVVCLVNGLTAFSLTRLFGLLFAGKPTQMTERSPEVHWPMMLPTLIAVGFTLHLPLLLSQWQLIAGTETLTLTSGILIASSVVGVLFSSAFYLNRYLPVYFPKPLQDLLAYDFYTAQIYRISVVFVVAIVSRVLFWIDRYIVDGFVNLVGIVTVFGGQSLKYNVSGQSQFYAFTIVLSVALFLGMLALGLS